MRDLPVGNGRLLVNFDDKYQIRDIYFPHVGQENHTEGFPFRFGVWADGEFSWIHEDEWERSLKYRSETLVTDVTLMNGRLGISLSIADTAASHKNIFLRCVDVRDLFGRDREVRVFLHQDFRIYENKVGDTAYFDPEAAALIHYKKHRYFLIGTDPPFNELSTGRKAFRDQEGTWRDAEDGRLDGGVITEGSVDSTVGVHLSVPAGETARFHYWIAAGTDRESVVGLHRPCAQPLEQPVAQAQQFRAAVHGLAQAQHRHLVAQRGHQLVNGRVETARVVQRPRPRLMRDPLSKRRVCRSCLSHRLRPFPSPQPSTACQR